MNSELRILGLKDLERRKFRVASKPGDVLYVRNPYFKGKPDYLPQIIKLAKSFKRLGRRVVDANIASGKLGKGKWQDYQKLKKAGLTIPKTKILTNYQLPTIHYPLILKWIYGLKGKGTFLINSQISTHSTSSGQDFKFQKIIGQHPTSEWMAQEYIDADFEYKIITVGFKALPVILKFKFNKKLGRVNFGSHQTITITNNHDQISEIAEKASRVLGRELAPSPFLPLDGGGEEGVKKVIKIAQKASKVLGRELAKVDILEKDGKFYILEVNRFPGLESFEKLSGFNAFGAFLKYLPRTNSRK